VDEIRRKRIEGELRELVSQLIISGQVKDPRVGPFVSVTRVEAARDLSNAKVFVSVLPGAGAKAEGDQGKDSEDERIGQAVEGLQHAAGFIQSQLGKRLKTRLTPRLSFFADRGIKEGFELGERMKGLLS
jgi:ribosome-binding factor A